MLLIGQIIGLNYMKKKIKNRAITQARFLYLYFLISGILMFGYAIASVLLRYFTEINLPLKYTPAPLLFLIGWFLAKLTIKNYKTILLYLKDVNQGRLMLNLIETTHFGPLHRDKIVKWVYLPRKSIRNHVWLNLSYKVQNGIELTKEEKKQYKYKVRILPQQVTDGINKAILVNALIWAHKNVCVLDDEVRDVLELTDANMDKFDMGREIDRCKKEAYREDYNRRMKIGLDGLKESQCQN